VTRLGDDVRVVWPARGVELLFAAAHDGPDGLQAEVSAALYGRSLEPWGRLDLSGPKARNDKAKLFAAVAPGLPWGPMLDVASRLVRDTLRQGEPAQELQRAAMTAAPYFVHPMLPEHQPSVLFAAGGQGKTQLAYLLAYSVRHLVPLPGMTVPDEPVTGMVLDWESDPQDAAVRATLAASALGVPVTGVHYRRMTGALVHHVAEVRREFQATGARFGIVDSMLMAEGDTLRDGWESACIRLFESLRAIGEGISWLILTHVPKGDMREPAGAKPFGSIYTENEARSVWRLDGQQDGPQLTLTLTNTKANRAPLHRPLGLRLTFEDEILSVTSADPLVLATTAGRT
jgi:hypothetical protein